MPSPPSPVGSLVRRWALAEGYDVGTSGRLPAWLVEAWEAAGSPALPAPPRGPRSKKRRGTPKTPGVPALTTTMTAATTAATPTAGGPARPASRAPARVRLPAGTAPVPPSAPPPGTGVTVTTVAGMSVAVLTADEARWFEAAKAKYLAEHRFTAGTDMADLDRLLALELVGHRWSTWMFSGTDYAGRPVDVLELARKAREQSAAINALKEQMGLSRKARTDASAGVAERWDDLLRRAKAFGYHRTDQARQAMVLLEELASKVGTFDRCDDEERRYVGLPDEHALLQWVREDMLPRYRAVDAAFLAQTQSMWARTP